MGKPSRPRALGDTQARAVGRNIRVSPRKLNLVAQSIRGRTAESALAALNFSPKRIALDVKKILESAIANAENNHDLDVDDLVVTEASVGRNLTMKRFHARARGRGARIEKPFAQLTIVVEEKPEAKEPKAKVAKGKNSSGKKASGAVASANKDTAGKKSGKSKEKA